MPATGASGGAESGPARLTARLVASLIDAALIVASAVPGLALVGIAALLAAVRTHETQRIAIALGTFGLLAAYAGLLSTAVLHVILLARRGSTPGKRRMGLLVIAGDARTPGTARATAREVLRLLCVALIVPALWPAVDRDRRALYDRMLGLKLVKRAS